MINWDFQGWDYFSVQNISQWPDCKSACDQDDKCHAWTFDASRSKDQHCFLKSGIPLKFASWTCVSGVKQQKTNQQQQPVWIYINRVLSQYNPASAHSPIHSVIWMESPTLTSQWSLELDIFIDHSVIEVFEPQGGRAAITARVYPEEEDAKNLAVYALQIPTNNDTIVMKSLDFWALNTIWT
jgi:sucrose-6-phosphate hydrolase SacC (GH32 family)